MQIRHGSTRLVVTVLLTAACDDRRDVPAAPRVESSRVAPPASTSAPAPAPLVTVPLPGRTLTLSPFTGFGFGAESDPVNLIWIGRADPRALRADLLALDGDRTALGFPNVFPFNCTW